MAQQLRTCAAPAEDLMFGSQNPHGGSKESVNFSCRSNFVASMEPGHVCNIHTDRQINTLNGKIKINESFKKDIEKDKVMNQRIL